MGNTTFFYNIYHFTVPEYCIGNRHLSTFVSFFLLENHSFFPTNNMDKLQFWRMEVLDDPEDTEK